MAGSVVFRHGCEIVDGYIIPNDEALTWDDADKRAGFRLDRRKVWAFIPDCCDPTELCSLVHFTRHCTGCTEVPEYTHPPDRGIGCRECGFTGRVRHSEFVPHSILKGHTND